MLLTPDSLSEHLQQHYLSWRRQSSHLLEYSWKYFIGCSTKSWPMRYTINTTSFSQFYKHAQPLSIILPFQPKLSVDKNTTPPKNCTITASTDQTHGDIQLAVTDYKIFYVFTLLPSFREGGLTLLFASVA